MLKKTLVALAITATAFAAQAKETITVINPSNKASPATVFAKSIEEAISQGGKYNVEFYQASSCADATKKYNSTKNAVVVGNADVNIAALSKKVECGFPATAANTSMIAKSYLKICRKPNSKVDFGVSGRTTVGLASVINSQGLFDDMNQGKRQLVGVPYSGSKTVLAAVLAGDINWGIIGAGVVNEPEKRGEVVCEYDSDPRAKNFLGNTIKGMKVPTIPILHYVSTNSKDAGIKAHVQASMNGKALLETLDKKGFADVKTTGITAADTKAIESHINNTYKHYWSK